MSQAAASQQIKRLEEVFGTSLFVRQGRKLALAPAGERLEAEARRLVAQSDALLASMRAAPFEGEVRFGVPYDIVGSFVPSILRGFAKAQPRVQVSLVCEDSRVVLKQLRSGGVDLALTTETECGRHGETLRTDQLVWVGAPGGDAYAKDPLPVSLGAPSCTFRPVAIEALGKVRRDWRAVCEVSRMEPVHAALEADLAVAPLLRSRGYHVDVVSTGAEAVKAVVVRRPGSEVTEAELIALVQEHCFHYLEAPIERVTGWDTPYPHAQEWAYFPGPVRVGAALKRVMEV